MPIVVFDFDHTLTTCDSTAKFFAWRLRNSGWRLLILALLTPLWLVFSCTKPTRVWPIHFSVWLATLFTSDQAFFALQQQFVGPILAPGSSSELGFLLGDGKQALARHQANGDQIVVATGAISSLVQLILEAESIQNLSVVGSTLKRRWGGLVADQHCLGPNKLRMLNAAGFKPPYSSVYSDHSADFPIFKHALAAVLVNPKAKCVAKLQQSLPESLRIEHWR